MVGEQCLERGHDAVGIDYARRGRLEDGAPRADALAVPQDLGRGNPSRRHANRPAVLVQPLQLLVLRVRLRDDPLARPPVADAVRLAEGVEEVSAAEAQPRLERVGAVVDARVDDLAVSGRCFRADGCVALDEERRRVGLEGEVVGYREADYAAADDLAGISLAVDEIELLSLGTLGNPWEPSKDGLS